MMRPLNIAGLGVVSPLGASVSEFWSRICTEAGAPVSLDSSFITPEQVANRLFYLSGSTSSAFKDAILSRAFSLAADAIFQALGDSGMDMTEQRVGLVLGTGAGEIEVFERHEFACGEVPADGAYTLAARLGREFGFDGPVLSVSTACSSSATAFALALELLEDQEIDAVVICGVESASRTTQAAFNKLQALDGERCRPFESDRAGTVLGDGAAALVLRRGEVRGDRRVYARLRGVSLVCDAYHPTAMCPDGAKIDAAARDALAQAGIGEDSIGLIVPHGTGTVLNDSAEYAMLQGLFGHRLPSIPIFPLKGKIGHTGGGAGAFSVMALALMLHYQAVPPADTRRIAPEFQLHVPKSLLSINVTHGLVNAYAFGGNHASLVLEAA